MTSHPIKENHFNWWLTTGKWRRLHAIPGTAITPEQMRAAIDDAQPARTASACGLNRPWDMPGIGSRLSLPRCSHCCRALAIPTGSGTPVNEQDRTRKDRTYDRPAHRQHDHQQRPRRFVRPPRPDT